jgi:hypothetical protein
VGIEKTPTIVAWKPRGLGNFLCEGPWRRALLAAVKGVQGQKMDRSIYFSLLADRVQSMMESEEDPESALDQMYEAFYEEDLADGDKPSIDQVGSKLIYGNLPLWEHFSFLGLPGSLPKRLGKNNLEAARVIDDTGLECWYHNLLMKPYNPDR